MLCPYRDRCMVPIGRHDRNGRWHGEKVPASSIGDYRCGFELAGTVEGCPKARIFREGAGDVGGCGLDRRRPGGSDRLTDPAGMAIPGR